MICPKCGKPVSEGAKFCTDCGQKIEPVTPMATFTAPAASTPKNDAPVNNTLNKNVVVNKPVTSSTVPVTGVNKGPAPTTENVKNDSHAPVPYFNWSKLQPRTSHVGGSVFVKAIALIVLILAITLIGAGLSGNGYSAGDEAVGATSDASKIVPGEIPAYIEKRIASNAKPENYEGSYTGTFTPYMTGFDAIAAITGENEEMKEYSLHSGETFPATAECDGTRVSLFAPAFVSEAGGLIDKIKFSEKMENGVYEETMSQTHESYELTSTQKVIALDNGGLYIIMGMSLKDNGVVVGTMFCHAELSK